MSHSIKATLQYGIDQLASIENAKFESELLLAQVLAVNRSYLYAHQDDLITEKKYLTYIALCERRKLGEPVAYLVGQKEFWSREFEVNKATLIPRPDTELLVELILKKFPGELALNLLELGVGSGAIAITIALERPSWKIIATDISVAALEVTLHNINKYQVTNITLMQSNWFSQIPQQKFDVIVSNPPYIAENDEHLSALTFEPSSALISGKDGLDAIKLISRDSRQYLKPGASLFLEHGCDQAERVREILENDSYVAIKSYTDFGGNLRVTQGDLNDG